MGYQVLGPALMLLELRLCLLQEVLLGLVLVPEHVLAQVRGQAAIL